MNTGKVQINAYTASKKNTVRFILNNYWELVFCNRTVLGISPIHQIQLSYPSELPCVKVSGIKQRLCTIMIVSIPQFSFSLRRS